ncbi:MAG: cell division ATP-binding protein FtsE [Proteobacteria bacterium]|nr:cell division ATP-binding protein FtsE [Pseudomonadota bacterium]
MIRMYNVSKEYPESTALKNVSFRVDKGEFCYITGPSGAGKTTMLKLLYGAIKPTDGKLMVSNIDVSSLSRKMLPQLRRNVGVVFQDFKLIPRRTVAENIGLALEVLGVDRPTIRRRVSAVLSIVGLQGRERLYPEYLSGGEQQRVAVARAIVNDPTLLLADEPTGNLDGAMAVEVMEILQAINLRGTTVLVATHDAALMQRFPFRRLQFKGGRLVSS